MRKVDVLLPLSLIITSCSGPGRVDSEATRVALVGPTIEQKAIITPTPLSPELDEVLNDARNATVIVQSKLGYCTGVVLENQGIGIIATDLHCIESYDESGNVTDVAFDFTIFNPSTGASIQPKNVSQMGVGVPDYHLIGFNIDPNEYPGGQLPFGTVDVEETLLATGD